MPMGQDHLPKSKPCNPKHDAYPRLHSKQDCPHALAANPGLLLMLGQSIRIVPHRHDSNNSHDNSNNDNGNNNTNKSNSFGHYRSNIINMAVKFIWSK